MGGGEGVVGGGGRREEGDNGEGGSHGEEGGVGEGGGRGGRRGSWGRREALGRRGLWGRRGSWGRRGETCAQSCDTTWRVNVRPGLGARPHRGHWGPTPLGGIFTLWGFSPGNPFQPSSLGCAPC